jgi:hypothetical protein
MNGILKEAAVAYLKVLFLLSLRAAEEHQKEPRSVLSVSRPEFEPSTPGIKIRRIAAEVTCSVPQPYRCHRVGSCRGNINIVASLLVRTAIFLEVKTWYSPLCENLASM